MAELSLRWTDNVAGPYYVDEECIDCSLCSEIAPDNFRINEEAGHDYVYKQPATSEEEDLCIEAMESCPVEAIGNDGEG
ncbi:MAG: ferredoxin [SAR324 cluster bacterium]|nr:ferredoxin [SAR324 cluster bacterium]